MDTFSLQKSSICVWGGSNDYHLKRSFVCRCSSLCASRFLDEQLEVFMQHVIARTLELKSNPFLHTQCI